MTAETRTCWQKGRLGVPLDIPHPEEAIRLGVTEGFVEPEKLIQELAGLPGMLWVVGGGEVVSENESNGMKEPTLDGGYLDVEADNWHFHLKPDSVAGIQFVEAEDQAHGVPFLYYVRFSGAAEETMMRVYFPNPYMDGEGNAAEFQPEKLGLFEDLRDRYTGRDGIEFVKRTLQQQT